MPGKMRTPPEALPTLVALEGLLSGVGDAVLSKDRKCRKGSAALFTLVWFLS